ncbi:hypothetical protein E6C27_scaffold25G001240 [Cucumis melo var. makuwa]|uniref:DNA-directed RNA polymerase I subunit RPA1-like n=1 Tax=Cucumis melo var. makuwa TaxID=1194695 RepID=A0A5A7VHJ4_CUCMM|nr:hypothetical protein E6C27_scaffold25G001240 [Cucumis melo var. makuwa]
MLMDLEVTVQYVVKHWSGCGSWSLDGEGQCLNLYYLTDKAYGGTCALRISASFGSTRLICASFGSTRLICASFGSTRLICASFGSTRLICAFYGTTRLLCRVGAQRGADRREAGRMREGHMDASGVLIASAMRARLALHVAAKRLGYGWRDLGWKSIAKVREDGLGQKSTALDLMRLTENISDRDGLRWSARSTGGKITLGARVCGDLRRGWGGAPTTADGRLDVMVD